MSKDESVGARLQMLVKRLGSFLVIGVIGFAVDAGVYNALVFWAGEGPLFRQPLVAKIIAILAATVVTYFGNRWWTFSERPVSNRLRQYLLYAAFNAVAIALQLGCLAFSRYVLGLSTPLADNVSGTLVGQAVAVVFRFWAYDKFVFARSSDPDHIHRSGASQ